MNRKPIAGGLQALLCLAATLLAQYTALDTTSGSTSKITYTFKTLNYPHDPFTQLFGINNAGEIVGHHGTGQGEHFSHSRRFPDAEGPLDEVLRALYNLDRANHNLRHLR